MNLQRIIGGRNILACWWHNNVLVVEDSRHRTWAYGGVAEAVYEGLLHSEEPDAFFSVLIAHQYPRERVFLASPQTSTIDPANLPF